MSDKISFDKKDLICQMCKEPFYNPIFIPTCGHHCCKDCLLNIIKLEPKKNNRKCVICRTVLPDYFTTSYLSTVKINFLLQNMVMDNFSVECENRCGTKLLDYQQETHNDNCINYPILCPNNNNGCFKKIPKKNIYSHLEECEFHACIGKRYGCRVIGTKSFLLEHQDACQNKIIGQNIENKLIENFNSYIDDKIKKYNDRFQRKHNLLNSKIFEQNKKMLKLTSQFNKLKEKLELYNILPNVPSLNNTQNSNNNINANTNANTNTNTNANANTNINTNANTNTNTNANYNLNNYTSTNIQNTDNNLNIDDIHFSEEEYETDNDNYQDFYDETTIFNINNNTATNNTATNNTATNNTTTNNTTTNNTTTNNTATNNTIREHTIEPLFINVSNRNFNRNNLLRSLLGRIDTDINNILNENGTYNINNNQANNSNYNTFTDT